MPTDMVAHLTPYTLSVDEQSWARAAFCWALRTDLPRMVDSVSHLPDPALREVEFAVRLMDAALAAERRRRTAAAVLLPDMEMTQ